ncbi:MAG: hypothetical protein ACM3ZA_10320 [Bacillota bacterium]
MYENMTPQQRLRAYVALMLPAIRRAAAEGKLPAPKPAATDGGGRAAESKADTSRQTA